MAYTGYTPDPSGGIRFHDDAGGSLLSFGPAAQAQAMQLDAAAAASGGGAMRPTDYYASLGVPGVAGASGDGREAVQGALFGGQAGGTPQPAAPPPVAPAGPGSNGFGTAPSDAPAGPAPTGSPLTTQPLAVPSLVEGGNGFGTGFGGAPSGPALTLSPAVNPRLAGVIGTGGGDVGRAQSALGVVGVPGDTPFLPPMSADAAAATQMRENKGGVDPTTTKFQTFGGASGQGGGVQAPAKLGTGNPLLDQLNAEAMQPARFVRTQGGWTPGSRTFKREATPDTESFHRYGEKMQNLAGIQAEGAEKRAEGERKQADVLAELVPEEQARIGQTLKNVEAFRARAEKAIADVDADRKRLAEAKVDPSHFFSNMSVGQQIMGMVSIIAGAFGQALTGGKTNVGLEMMQRAIEQDIAAQRDNIEQGNKNLSASERRVELEAKQLGSMEMALDLQRVRAFHAAQAKAKVLEAEAKSDAERQQAREFIAATDAKLYELNMKFNAARNGDQIYTEQYRPGGLAQVGGMKRSERMELAKLNMEAGKADAAAQKAARENAPQTLVYGDKRVALRPEVSPTEAAKYREAAGALQAIKRDAKRLNELNTIRGKLSPEQLNEAEGLRESISSTWSIAKGQGVVTNQQATRFESSLSGFLGGKGGVKALVDSVDSTVDGIVRQSGAGYINADGSVQPFSD